MHLSIQRSQRWVKASVLRDSGRSFWEAKLCAVESFRAASRRSNNSVADIAFAHSSRRERTTPLF